MFEMNSKANKATKTTDVPAAEEFAATGSSGGGFIDEDDMEILGN